MNTAIVKPQGAYELPNQETAITLAPVSSLPTIAEIKQKMAWMTEFRAVLKEFIQYHMDPRRHMYNFENNRYTPMTIDALQTMIAEGKKPALNQDGIHNLMSLYECYADEPMIAETREDGFYTCRATVHLISFRSGLPMGAGTGSCSTRESKYAYRWVYDKEVPKGVDKASLKQREFPSRSGGRYTKYRLDNEDLADVEATVLQMAVKRAKSAAVKCLPLVSEMFATVGDPDEETKEDDAARQELLKPIGVWMRSVKPATARADAIQAVFGEPLTPQDVNKLDEDRLAVGLRVMEIGKAAGVDWGRATVERDLQAALMASAIKAKADLFGDDAETMPPQKTGTKGPGRDAEVPNGQKATPNTSLPVRRTDDDLDDIPEGINPETGELFDLEASAADDLALAEEE